MTTADPIRPASTVDPKIDPALASVFPPDFLWGVASSAYQVEGAVQEDGRGLSIWDRFAATPGRTYEGQTGEFATDHYHRMAEDVALMAELGIRAYRFSVAWPRVLPDGVGRVNELGLDFYDRLVDALLSHGIQPAVTLYHWDLPVALQDRGGWQDRDTAFAFADYSEIVARRLGDRAKRWITMNEPWCAAYLGHGNGEHAPGLRDVHAAIAAGHHLLLGHGLALPRLRATVAGAEVGITIDFSPGYAADASPETAAAVNRHDDFRNRWFADAIFRGSYPQGLFDALGGSPPPVEPGDMAAISAPVDFLGVNYYSRSIIRAPQTGAGTEVGAEYVELAPGATYTEMGWEVFPQGLSDLLMQLHDDYHPRALIVTENGAAFDDDWNGDSEVRDPQRVSYLAGHVEAMAQAMQRGAPVTGYFLWSLTDNFEWAYGYNKRFGIVYIDYPTQRRIVKDSGRWYAVLLASLRR
jgi:beta-glucosidase